MVELVVAAAPGGTLATLRVGSTASLPTSMVVREDSLTLFGFADDDEKQIFESEWQSFRLRKSKGEVEALTFSAEFHYPEPGVYRIAARVTDVFGNDGISTVSCEVP